MPTVETTRRWEETYNAYTQLVRAGVSANDDRRAFAFSAYQDARRARDREMAAEREEARRADAQAQQLAAMQAPFNQQVVANWMQGTTNMDDWGIANPAGIAFQAPVPTQRVYHPLYPGAVVNVPAGVDPANYVTGLRNGTYVAEGFQPPAPQEEEMPETKRARFARELLLGADPEFVILKDGEVQNAERLVPHSGELGYDHSGWVLEMRPKPSRTAYGLTRRLAGLMSGRVAKRIESYRWKAGAYCPSPPTRGGLLTLGGHIHFGHERPKDAYSKISSPFLEVEPVIQTLIDLTAALEAVDILPAKACEQRRKNSSYGRLDDARGGDDGRHHWEYRAMPSWLYHPDTTFLCVALGKLVVLHPKTVGKILAEGKANPNKAIKLCLERFGRDVDARRALELLPMDSPKKLVHDPEAEIRETWRGEIAAAEAEAKELGEE